MQTLENPTRALRKLRRLARVRKANLVQQQGQPPNPPELARQQTAAESTARQPGDWPPNTWWP